LSSSPTRRASDLVGAGLRSAPARWSVRPAALHGGTADYPRRLDAWLRPELLRTSDVDVRGVEIPLGIDVELMDAPEAAGERAEGPPGRQESPIQVVFRELLRQAR